VSAQEEAVLDALVRYTDWLRGVYYRPRAERLALAAAVEALEDTARLPQVPS
jgi:hypothetical protein